MEITQLPNKILDTAQQSSNKHPAHFEAKNTSNRQKYLDFSLPQGPRTVFSFYVILKKWTLIRAKNIHVLFTAKLQKKNIYS